MQSLIPLLALALIGANGILITPDYSSLTPSSNRFWNSSSGEFGFGFFKPPGAPANTSYAAIVYLNGVSTSPPDTPVWIANRNRPVSDNSSLRFTADSGLVLVDSGQIIWRTSSGEGAFSSSGAELLNNGNLVVYSSRNSSEILWQSFETPTHTLLPGQKLSASLMSSWRSRADPSPGSFALTISQAMSKLRLLHLSPDTTEYEYWSQAQSTELVFSDELNSTLGAITVGWIMNKTSSLPAQCSGFVSSRYQNFSKRLVLDPDGNLRYYARAPGSAQWLVLWRALYDSCYVYNYCGSIGVCNFDVDPRPECPLPEEPSYCSCPVGYNNSTEPQLGCQRSAEDLRCPSRGAVFSRIENVGYDLSNPIGREIVAGESRCEERCSRSLNCSCLAGVFSKSSSECWLLSSLVNGNFSSKQESLVAFVRVPGESSDSKALSTGTKIGVSAAGGLVGIVLLILAGWLLKQKLKQRRTIRDGILDVVGEYGLKSYRYEYLRLITDGFKRIIGQGGYGVVYLGIDPKGEKLAVKVFKVSPTEDSEADTRTFLAEVESLAGMSHANVVKLLGFCLRGSGAERALVYEYVENSSLDRHLFQKTTDLTKLSTRIDILSGAAKGIEYFHKYSGRKVVHRDIKPANILLDKNFEAKVADFGMAKMVQAARASVSTTFTLAGTLTYKAPESTVIGAAVTVKADVFSFGVTCIEAVTGKKMVFTSGQRASMSGCRTMLFRSVLGLIENRCYEDLVDERVELEVGEVENVVRVLRLAGWCMQEDPRKRPDMEIVAMALKGEKVLEQPLLGSLPRYLLEDHLELEEDSEPNDKADCESMKLGSAAGDNSITIMWKQIHTENNVDAR